MEPSNDFRAVGPSGVQGFEVWGVYGFRRFRGLRFEGCKGVWGVSGSLRLSTGDSFKGQNTHCRLL